MSGFPAQRSRPPWMGIDPGAATSSEPSAANKDSTNASASAISFGFAATAILICMFLVMAIFEHLIKPGWVSSRRSLGEPSPSHDGSPAGKLSPPPKTEDAVDLTVVMPGQRYPTFLAHPAPLRREGMRWPLHLHEHRRASQQPPWMMMMMMNSVTVA